ncbi:MAG TPA: PQQ-dependent sugar dehydrogenase [Candidatus Saccharimonadales bacterium]|nr:PQQ-dependent sugar dehydrogenase [Candidatus Saccharimonadales bacterium]
MKRGGQSYYFGLGKNTLFIAVVVTVAIAAATVWLWAASQTVQPAAQPSAKSTQSPTLTTNVVVQGYSPIWDVDFLTSGDMLFTERKGVINTFKDGQSRALATISDVSAKGEGGLMALAVDPKFDSNRFIYTCFNSSKNDIRIVRWRVSPDVTALESRVDIVTGIPANATGRHSGCQLVFGPDSYLWVGTGDSAQGDTGIQPKSLGGKILRIDRDGSPAPGNIGGQYDPRVFSYGHRNVQGLAFFAEPINGLLGISTEHGSDTDDEINPLRAGNFGWAPAAKGYNETGVPMTDKKRFPDAVDALWSSGKPTQALSGATILKGSQWKSWEGALVVATLKAQHLKIMFFDQNAKIVSDQKEFSNQFGRIRTAVQGPDGNLYMTTDNSLNNQIIRVTPH